MAGECVRLIQEGADCMKTSTKEDASASVAMRMQYQSRAALMDFRGASCNHRLAESGYAVTPTLLTPEECAELRGLYPQRRTVSQSCHHGAPSLWTRRLQVFRQSASCDGARASHSRVSSPGRGRESHGRRSRTKASSLPCRACCVSRALPSRRTETPHTAAVALRTGWLQLPASGHLRRGCVSAADGLPAGAARARLARAESLCWWNSVRVRNRRPRSSHADERMRRAYFTTRYRPVQGSKGYYRVNMKHGVARVRAGRTRWDHLS